MQRTDLKLHLSELLLAIFLDKCWLKSFLDGRATTESAAGPSSCLANLSISLR